MSNGDIPAMPVKSVADYQGLGLTKREHFAAMAMQGLISSFGSHDVWNSSEVASDAVIFADALLAELERTS
ncbi:MAG: hypothetical protein VX796_05970 [Pseudomonadota bacterium]|nr:hypothetical protein [Pseudomonadota bacterium]